MKQFFAYRFRAQALLLCFFCVLTAMLVLMSSFAFFLPAMGRQEGLELFRQRFPLAAEVLRMRISLTGEDHLLSTLYGLLLPLISLLYAFYAVRALQAKPMETGEMYWFICAPHSPARVPLIHFLVVMLGLLIQGLCVPLFALLPAFWQPGWQADVWQLVLAAMGSVLFFALPAGIFLLEAAGCGKEGMPKRGLIAFCLTGIVRLAANVHTLPRELRFATPFSLYDIWGLARGQKSAWTLAGIAFALGLVFVLAAARHFACREMEL